MNREVLKAIDTNVIPISRLGMRICRAFFEGAS